MLENGRRKSPVDYDGKVGQPLQNKRQADCSCVQFSDAAVPIVKCQQEIERHENSSSAQTCCRPFHTKFAHQRVRRYTSALKDTLIEPIAFVFAKSSTSKTDSITLESGKIDVILLKAVRCVNLPLYFVRTADCALL
ncbi:hypothetical protein GHT06_022039 [Daphnia sinensis]|uniref:Uncharacterized protein n=1 Tax=Daphnia sinensis TaxID=1820382 RepID=A0AAD5L622_9CRUS|nr:hypothetical protein GHT06_022039 [Daphnia sinensis]